MSQYAYNQQGACSLKIFSDNILLRSMEIERAGWKLEDRLKEHGDAIGVYRDNILSLLEKHRSCLCNFSETAHLISAVSAEICQSIQQFAPERNIIIADYGYSQEAKSCISEEALVASADHSLSEDNLNVLRKALHIYFVIESSSRVNPITLEVLRNSIEESLPELNDIGDSTGIDIKIQTLTYNIGVVCLDKEPISTKEYTPHQIEPFGLCNFGEACAKVSALLCLSNYLQFDPWVGYQPIIFYLIASNPTSDCSYGVSKLHQNTFYQKCCQKHVCFLGNQQNIELYSDLLGNDVNITHIFTPEQLLKSIKFIDLREDWFDLSSEYG